MTRTSGMFYLLFLSLHFWQIFVIPHFPNKTCNNEDRFLLYLIYMGYFNGRIYGCAFKFVVSYGISD